MTIVMLLLLVVPLTLAVTTLIDYADDIASWSRSAATLHVPPPPDWVDRVPLLGSKLATEWRQLSATPTEELAARAAPYIRTAVLGLAVQAGGVAVLVLHFSVDRHRDDDSVYDWRNGCKGSAPFCAAACRRPR
jgi:predicted PurR-regulated permease PerM